MEAELFELSRYHLRTVHSDLVLDVVLHPFEFEHSRLHFVEDVETLLGICLCVSRGLFFILAFAFTWVFALAIAFSIAFSLALAFLFLFALVEYNPLKQFYLLLLLLLFFLHLLYLHCVISYFLENAIRMLLYRLTHLRDQVEPYELEVVEAFREVLWRNVPCLLVLL